MVRPEAESQEERQFVAETILNHWAIGDFKFLYEDYDPPLNLGGMDADAFLDKWEEYIAMVATDLEDELGRLFFGDEWEVK